MSVLCVVLARAGSKGVPGKNAALVAGRPCVEWTLDAAQAAMAAGVVSRVVLSTDGPALAEIARARGIETVDRPEALASDTARVDDAVRHAVETVERRHGSTVEAAVILYGNVPVRPEGLVAKAVGMLAATCCDSVQSYQGVGKHHPWWTARLGEDGAVRPWEGEVLNGGVYRRQDLPPAVVPDGAVLCVTRQALFAQVPGAGEGPHAFFGVDRRGIVNPAGSVVDIDDELDLIVADAVLRRRVGAGGGEQGGAGGAGGKNERLENAA